MRRAEGRESGRRTEVGASRTGSDAGRETGMRDTVEEAVQVLRCPCMWGPRKGFQADFRARTLQDRKVAEEEVSASS